MAFKLREALAQALLTFLLFKKLNVQTSPTAKLVGIMLAVQYALSNKFIKSFLQIFQLKFSEGMVDRSAAVLLKAAPVKKEYSKNLTEVLDGSRPKTAKKWEDFGELVTAIPEDGCSFSTVKALIDRLAARTEKDVGDEFYSGSIYSYSYMSKKYRENEFFEPLENEKLFLDKPADYDQLTASLAELYSYSFHRSYLWNQLHEAEFGVGYWLNYQVVRMVADLYGGSADKVMGYVTTGGTDSIMNAVRMYREWGMVNRDHDIGQGVILCAESVHAAVNKGGMAYGVNVELLPVDAAGKFDIPALKKAVARVGNDLVAIVGSTPSYPIGVIDPIREIAAIAKKAGVGMHVDSCLGGFIVNFLDHIDTDYLKVPGVTSLSCDTHKNGWAPKGSSVLVTLDIPDKLHTPTVNLAFYSAYSIPGWDGGIYGTPSNPGSQHVTHLLHAYLAMLRIGKSGYRKIANNIYKVVTQCSDIIREEPRLELIGDSPANVVSWQISPQSGFGRGAIYALAHELSKRKIVVSALKGERLHYCVTGRSSADDAFVKAFEVAMKEALDVTEGYAKEVAAGKISFPGDAGLYGTMEAAMTPTAENTKSAVDYYANMLLGQRVAGDSVKAHFYALQDPYKKEGL